MLLPTFKMLLSSSGPSAPPLSTEATVLSLLGPVPNYFLAVLR